ncbi:DUF1345 domain-containing protein (plasmid) [Pedobacter sp. BS3]|nr:DUF1345 domain-containing protein [Pedobacter sp. BS3]
MLGRFNKLDSHHRLYLSVIVAVICYFLTGQMQQPERLMISWLSYCAGSLLLAWIIILSSHPKQSKSEFKLQDSSQTTVFLLVIAASVISLTAVIILLKFTKSLSEKELGKYILLCISCVICSWLLVHTVFTLRYAHLFYGDNSTNKKEIAGGLDFPGGGEPDYLDFVYFSFTIGMTFQVSDVEISSRRIRRLAWIHGMISFAFNAAIVALSINIISGLIGR